MIGPDWHYPARMSWQLDRGAKVASDGTVTFSVWAPRAASLAVRLLAPDGTSRGELPMQGEPNGVFTARVAAARAPAGSDYVYCPARHRSPSRSGLAPPALRRPRSVAHRRG